MTASRAITHSVDIIEQQPGAVVDHRVAGDR